MAQVSWQVSWQVSVFSDRELGRMQVFALQVFVLQEEVSGMVVPTGADATKNDFGTQVSSFAASQLRKLHHSQDMRKGAKVCSRHSPTVLQCPHGTGILCPKREFIFPLQIESIAHERALGWTALGTNRTS